MKLLHFSAVASRQVVCLTTYKIWELRGNVTFSRSDFTVWRHPRRMRTLADHSGYNKSACLGIFPKHRMQDAPGSLRTTFAMLLRPQQCPSQPAAWIRDDPVRLAGEIAAQRLAMLSVGNS